MTNMDIYELKTDFTDWIEVTKAEWIRAERAAGFSPHMSSDHPRYSETCATGGFSSSGGVSGRIRLASDAASYRSALAKEDGQ